MIEQEDRPGRVIMAAVLLGVVLPWAGLVALVWALIDLWAWLAVVLDMGD